MPVAAGENLETDRWMLPRFRCSARPVVLYRIEPPLAVKKQLDGTRQTRTETRPKREVDRTPESSPTSFSTGCLSLQPE